MIDLTLALQPPSPQKKKQQKNKENDIKKSVLLLCYIENYHVEIFISNVEKYKTVTNLNSRSMN